jgi:2-keto-4-pentenoate hydratase/2-oxohepta-3-ene-1,7-dioic acid hydratase in catechol pathway
MLRSDAQRHKRACAQPYSLIFNEDCQAMKIVRYRHQHGEFHGALEDGTVRPLSGQLDQFKPVSEARPLKLSEVELLAPVIPTKIVAVGINYRDHAQEMGHELPREPLLFLKPPSSVIGPEGQIIYPPQTSRLDYEGELAIIIGKRARRVAAKDAGQYILGFTCLIDVTARDLQRIDGQFTRSKGFDTFAPIGPAIATDVDPSDLQIETRLNGERRQLSRTSQLIFPCDELLSYISHIMTLEPGDVITTGTPSGVGPMKPGDVIEVEIEKIGCLRCTVARAPS